MADFTDEDDALLAELGVVVETKPVGARTSLQERIIAGFEDIQRFVDEHGPSPQHGEGREIFERLYAVRLDRIAQLPECCDLVGLFDRHGLLQGIAAGAKDDADDLDDDALLAELGIDDELSEITELRHVRPSAEKRAADEIANRERCTDFASFKPLFEQVQRDLDQGIRTSRKFERKSEIEPGRFFILGGQKAYVAEMGKVEINASGHSDARLRVTFDNGTEGNLLMRSLQKALTSDEAGRRIDDPVAGPLFADQLQQRDEASDTIYVLRSKSDHPMVAAHRDLVHKIGVTSTGVKQRIAGARLQPTFLLADVEVVATYELFNINRSKFENLIHRIFDPARFDVEILDRFGRTVVPREWFMVPLFVIDKAVGRIKDKTIVNFTYDPKSAQLVEGAKH